MPSLQMVYDIIARDAASPAFARAGTSAEAAGRKIDGIVKAIAGFAVADLGYHVVKMAGDFEQLTNVLVTAAGESSKNLPLVRDNILKIATSTGTAWKEVTDATYTAEKAGYRAGDAYTVVRAAAQGAKEENAKLATVTNAVTSILADYHLKATDSVMVTNEMKTAAGEAKSTFEEFDTALSVVVPLASAMHISFADVAGTLAEVTQHGVSAQEAAQQLAFAMRNLGGRINGVAVNEMAQFGISATDVQAKIGDGPGGRGLAGTLNYLSETVLKRMGPAGSILLNTFNQSKQAAQDASVEFNALPAAAQKLAKAYEDGTLTKKDWISGTKAMAGADASLAAQWKTTEDKAKGFQSTLRSGLSQNQTYSQALQMMTGGANGLQAALQVAGQNIDSTNDKIKRIAESAKNAGQDVSGWSSTQKLFNVQFDMFKQSAEALGIKIGMVLLPALKDMLGVLTKHPAILQATAIAVGALAAAWAAMRIGSVVSNLGNLILKVSALRTVSAEAAGARGLGAIEGAAGGAAGNIGKVGGAMSAAGLVVGGTAILGTLALAAAWKQVFTNTREALPAVSDLLKAMAQGGGTKGPGGKAAITQSLTGASSGDNRGESQLDYFKRISAALDPGTGKVIGQEFNLNMDRLFKTIQGGDRGALRSFISDLQKAADVTGANSDTYYQLDKNYTDLFNTYSKGTSQLKDYTQKQKTAALNEKLLAEGAGTNADKLTKSYHLNAAAAAELAASNKQYSFDLSTVGAQLLTYNRELDGNSRNAHINRDTIEQAAQEVKAHAEQVYKLTGNLSLANQVFANGIGTIETNTGAVGANKDRVDELIRSVLGLPPSKTTQILAPGLLENLTLMRDYLNTLNNVPQQVQSTITTYKQEVALGQLTSLGGAAQGLNLSLGGHASGGFINGPGTGTSDSILARLSNGEYVIPSHVVKQMGVGFFDALRSGAQPRFAAGGLVSLNPAEQKYLTALAQNAKFDDYIKTHPAVGSFLTGLSEVSKYLKSMAASTTALTTKLTTFVQQQQQYRDSLKATVTSGATITDLLAQSGSVGDLKQLFAGKIGDIKTFAAKIVALKKQGWPDAIIREIAGDGVGIGVQYADLLLSASKADRSTLIGEANQLTGLQGNTATSITKLTGKVAGLTLPSAVAAVNKAAYTAGANTQALIAQAAAAQTKAAYGANRPLVHVENVHSHVDLDVLARQLEFRQRAGGF